MTVQDAAVDAARINDYLDREGYVSHLPVPGGNPAALVAMLPYGRVATFPDPLIPGLPKDQVYEVVYCDHDGKPRATVSNKQGAQVLELIQKLAAQDGLEWPEPQKR